MTSPKGQHARPKRTLVATEVEQPPPQKRRKKKENTITSPPPPPSFSLLPDEIILNCLTRIPKSHYRLLSLVSKTIRSLLSSPELYTVRSQIGNTEPCLYICKERESPTYDRWYTLDQTLSTDERSRDVFRLSRIKAPTSSSSPLKKSTILAVGFEIYQIGGTINRRERPSSAVRVLDCRTHTWRDAPDMTVARKRAKSAFIDGKIYVVGGTKGSKNCGEVFDLKSQTWKPLPSLSDVAEVLVQIYRGKIYAKSAANKHQIYAYDFKQERWKELAELGFGPEKKSGPWCVIENVKFSVFCGELMWYDSERRDWIVVKGLEDLYIKHDTTIQLASHGGKIVLVWDELRSSWISVGRRRRQGHFGCCGGNRGRGSSFGSSGVVTRRRYLCKNKSIRRAVIKLEKQRIGFSELLEIRGEILRSDVVPEAPNSDKLISCIITL